MSAGSLRSVSSNCEYRTYSKAARGSKHPAPRLWSKAERGCERGVTYEFSKLEYVLPVVVSHGSVRLEVWVCGIYLYRYPGWIEDESRVQVKEAASDIVLCAQRSEGKRALNSTGCKVGNPARPSLMPISQRMIFIHTLHNLTCSQLLLCSIPQFPEEGRRCGLPSFHPFPVPIDTVRLRSPPSCRAPLHLVVEQGHEHRATA